MNFEKIRFWNFIDQIVVNQPILLFLSLKSIGGVFWNSKLASLKGLARMDSREMRFEDFVIHLRMPGPRWTIINVIEG